MPSEHSVQIVLDRDVDGDVISLCISMLFETSLASKLSKFWDSMCTHRYAEKEQKRVMPGQKDFESSIADAATSSSYNKTFDYDTAYLEVVQRRKYAWIQEPSLSSSTPEKKDAEKEYTKRLGKEEKVSF